MSNRLPITGEYPSDWDEIGDRVRAEHDHRCIRCGHHFKTGEHGKGQWTPCDEKCTHAEPLAFLYADGDIQPVTHDVMTGASMTARNLLRWNAGRIDRVVVAEWRILTVHHLDGDKSNCEWWNLLALCQRCHLTIQSRVKPETPYFLEHSEWFRPYVAGFYAKKYENKLITRDEAVRRMDELLAYERLV